MRTLVAPPFHDGGEANDFYFLLMVFLRELKRSGDPVSLYQFLLAQALHHHRPAYREVECVSCGPPYPCRTVLAVALLTRFPAPWTPHSVAGALNAVGWLGATVRDDLIRWGDDDPGFTLTRDEDGAWMCEERQRASVHNYVIGSDTACYQFIAKNVRGSPIGFGTKVTEDEIDQIRGGIKPTNEWWLHHSAYPYITAHVVSGAELAAPLATGETPDGFFRLTADEAIDAVRAAILAIPAGHPLYKAPITPLAQCGWCYQAMLLGMWKRFALTVIKPINAPAQLPGPETELFDDYRDAFAAMRRHASTCTGRQPPT